MRSYTYQDVTDAGWIVVDHGFNPTTLTMAIILMTVIVALVVLDTTRK